MKTLSSHLAPRLPDTPGAPVSTEVRSLLRRSVLWPSWAGIVLLTLLSVLGLSVPESLRYGPLLVSVVLLGLPHGAADHLVLLQLDDDRPSLPALLRVMIPYLALAGAYLLVWFATPQPAFGLFILLTWFHWGQGDLHSLLVLSNAQHLPFAWQRWFSAFVRGGLPMLIPLLSFPSVYREVASDVIARLGAAPGPAMDLLFSPVARTSLGGTFAAASLVYLLVGVYYTTAASRSDWIEDALEVTILAGFFATVDPIMAIGVYFCLWHAPRHVARLAIHDRRAITALREGRIGPAVGRLTRQVLPMTVAAITLFGLLYVIVPTPPTTIPGIVALYLVLIAVLTLPHVWVVLRMDEAEGIWTSKHVRSPW